MKCYIIIIICILNSYALCAQNDFSKVDEFARNYNEKTTNVARLATELTSRYNNDLDKTRSIFIWITNYIQYDVKEYRKILNGKSESYRIEAGSEKELAEKKKRIEEEKLEESVKNTLSKRKGVCQNYSELFNAMCKSANIKSGMIDGSIKDITGQFIPNQHSWNWVEIEGKIYLLDATWASGYVDYSTWKYTRQFNDGFFLTPPGMFVVDHFPNDNHWQLMEDKITLETFKEFPAVGPGFFKYKVRSYSPKISNVSLKGKKFSVSIKFGIQPGSIKISNKGLIMDEYKNIGNDFSASLELKKSRGVIDIWADNELLISYKIK